MADIGYTPTFRDVPWTDRRDRATASGPIGFNSKFNAIAGDLRQLSTVVTRIGTAIDASNAPPPPQQQRLSFTPVLHTTSSSTGEWAYDASGVVSTASGEALGVANLTLPDGLRLTSVRVVGSIGRNSFGAGGGGVSLLRTPLRLVVPPPAPEALTGDGDIPGKGPFDLQIPVTASRALIDTSVFRYVFTANFTTITFGGLSIEAVHLTFAPPS
ncbi:hypothetical protein [Streptomyces hyaluromycini]|uniref:hypothetical protein n=1 Tax=Streptomyces hyaluromycini TaxID=1377993 RepID=UPI000B5C9D2C|nr:hypothetical protein [Streptomyces hyaluromycini]